MDLPDFLKRGQYGDIRLTGHRIDLIHVVDLYNEGSTVEMIAFEFDTLSIYLIEQVLDFYRKNKAEVDAYVAHSRAEIERQMAEHKPGPGVIRLRKMLRMIEEADAKYGSDPSWISLSVTEKVQRLQTEAGEYIP